MKNNEQNEKAVDTGKTLTEDDLTKNFSQDKQNSSNDDKKENLDKEKLNEENQKPDKSQEYLEMAQRTQAEFDNYRKRNMELARTSREDGISFAIETLLPVLDSINSAKRQITDEKFQNSLSLVYNQALDCFSKLGVKKIDAIGKKFNPDYHNAIMTEHKDGVEPDMVLDEFQEGFMFDGRVIRHTVVKVSK